MRADSLGPSLLGTAVLLAIVIIRAALREMREPGSARHEWAFVCDRRTVAIAIASALVLAALAWTLAGPASVPWAVLAGLFVTRVFASGR